MDLNDEDYLDKKSSAMIWKPWIIFSNILRQENLNLKKDNILSSINIFFFIYFQSGSLCVNGQTCHCKSFVKPYRIYKTKQGKHYQEHIFLNNCFFFFPVNWKVWKSWYDFTHSKTATNNGYIFLGSKNRFHDEREYLVEWTCNFVLDWFPFGTQRCTLEMFFAEKEVATVLRDVDYTGKYNFRAAPTLLIFFKILYF